MSRFLAIVAGVLAIAVVAAAVVTADIPALAATAREAGHARFETPDTVGQRRFDSLTEEQQRQLERLGTLGYLVAGGPAPEASGVTLCTSEACDGYTVYVSRDYPGAFVIDLDGRVLHTWRDPGAEHWTRACVCRDGSVLGISAYPARLVKLDSDSRALWTYGGDEIRAHHDVRLSPEGTIRVLMRRGRRIPCLDGRPALEDLVCVLRPDGELVRIEDCIDVPGAFARSGFADLLTAPWFGKGGDPFHVNSVEVLDGGIAHPAFRAGNLLLSIRNMDCLAVLDPALREIVWVSHGPWQRQHEARITPDGCILLFDNRKFEDRSRVVKYDVVRDEITWSYSAEGFFSKGTGAQQLLPNGNVLITESQKGRILEVTPDRRVVWEYFNPRRIADGRTIVCITRAFRVPYGHFSGSFGQGLAALRTGS